MAASYTRRTLLTVVCESSIEARVVASMASGMAAGR